MPITCTPCIDSTNHVASALPTKPQIPVIRRRMNGIDYSRRDSAEQIAALGSQAQQVIVVPLRRRNRRRNRKHGRIKAEFGEELHELGPVRSVRVKVRLI